MTFLEKIYLCHLKLTRVVEATLMRAGSTNKAEIEDVVALLKDVRNSALFPNSSSHLSCRHSSLTFAYAKDCVAQMDLDCLYAIPDQDVPHGFRDVILNGLTYRESLLALSNSKSDDILKPK